MKDGFFLNRINILRYNLIIYKGIKGAVTIFPDAAYASFAIFNNTSMAAETTLNLVFISLLIEHRFLHNVIIRPP